MHTFYAVNPAPRYATQLHCSLLTRPTGLLARTASRPSLRAPVQAVIASACGREAIHARRLAGQVGVCGQTRSVCFANSGDNRAAVVQPLYGLSPPPPIHKARAGNSVFTYTLPQKPKPPLCFLEASCAKVYRANHPESAPRLDGLSNVV
jgi:hypothetical protein